MQITVELYNQHFEKLRMLEKSLKKSTSEVIALAIDELLANSTARIKDSPDSG